MKRLFAVFRSEGAAWSPGRPLEEQRDWPAHAAFMNALESEGLILLGGPLEGTPERLLIARARSADEIRLRLAADPWIRLGILRQPDRVVPWDLRIGAIP